MKKTLWILVLFALATRLQGQIPVRFLVRDHCLDTLISAEGEYVYDKQKAESVSKEPNGIYLLEKGKEYKITIYGYQGDYYWGKSFTYCPTKKSAGDFIVERYPVAKLPLAEVLVIEDLIIEGRFFNCTELCDGHYVDYYRNGVIRLEGDFVQGKAVGDLKEYYENGNLKRHDKYEKPRNPVSFPNSEDKQRITERLIYYENGKLKARKTYSDWKYGPPIGVRRVLDSLTLYNKKGKIIDAGPRESWNTKFPEEEEL